MASTAYDLVGSHAIEHGFPWSFVFTRYAGASKTPIDLTGMGCRMDIFDAMSASQTPLMSVSSTGGEITLGGANGRTEITLPAEKTALPKRRLLRYRIVFIGVSGAQLPYLHGRIEVSWGPT